MKLIDTNVFIYAVGRPHEYKESCAEVIRRIDSGEVEANIDTELHQEILYRFWNINRTNEGMAIVDRLLAGFPDPFPVTYEVIREARAIFGAMPELAPRDALQASVVRTNGLEGIITTDRRFGEIPGVTRLDPKDI